MSSVKEALERLDRAVGKLDESLSEAAQKDAPQTSAVDVENVAQCLNRAIALVEGILDEDGDTYGGNHA